MNMIFSKASCLQLRCSVLLFRPTNRQRIWLSPLNPVFHYDRTAKAK